MTEASNKRASELFLPLTVSDIKTKYLFGLDLTNDDGDEMPDEMFEFYIHGALRWLETEIPGLILCETEITEWHDYHIGDYQAYSFLKLFKFPVQSVSKVGFQFPLQNSINDFNPEWFRIESNAAHVNLLPTAGTFSSLLLSQGGAYLPLLYSGTSYVPHLFRVVYKAGFKSGQIPHNLLNLIGMKAALGPLNVAGDLIAGAGISSKSLSMDGLSQSISTTASATNSGYGARIGQYTKMIKEDLANVKRYYTGINFVVA